MRDYQCDENILKSDISDNISFIEDDIKEIKQLEEDSLKGIKRFPRDNKDIIFSTKMSIASESLVVLNAKYSLGLKCESLEDIYFKSLPYITEVNLNIGYINIIQYISIGILLGVKKEILQAFVNKMDEVGLNDFLFDFIVKSYGLKRSIISNQFSREKPYRILMEIIELAKEDKVKAGEKLANYTEEQWIKGHSDCGWNNFPKQVGYVGLWSYEAGVVTKILKLDDSVLANSIHYPYDLVHYKENLGLNRSDITEEIINKSIINKSDEGIGVEKSVSVMPELDEIIPNEFRGYVEQIIIDYDSLSDKDMWQKYNLNRIWFSLDEYINEKKNGILGFIIVNLLVEKGYILQLDCKENPEDYIENIKSYWNCKEKVIIINLYNDQIYLAKVPYDIKVNKFVELSFQEYALEQ